MRKIKNKKGAGHVEMIISFVIFLSFIVFILIVFNPFRKPQTGPSLDIIETKILNYVSTNLTVFSVRINSSAYGDINSESCFIVNYTMDNNLIIKDEQESIISGKIENTELYFENSGEFYRVYLSEELQENDPGSSCHKINKGNYTIGATRVYNKVSSSKLDGFFQEYNSGENGYSQLKQNLSITDDFNVIITSGGNIIYEARRYKPEAIDIIAKDVPIEILDENANLNPVIMNIQVW